MKLKYYLRGLGIGIFVTAAILTIVYHTKGTLTDEQIMERASQLGMAATESEPDTLFPEDNRQTTDENNLTASAEETGTDENETTEPDTKETADTQPEETTPEETSSEIETTAFEPQVITATLTIRSGMFSEAVTSELAALGIITDQAEFNAYLNNNGYSEMIQTGDFVLTSDMSYEQIARIITRS